MPDDTYMTLLQHAIADIDLALLHIEAHLVPDRDWALRTTNVALKLLRQAHAIGIAHRVEYGVVFPKAPPPAVPQDLHHG